MENAFTTVCLGFLLGFLSKKICSFFEKFYLEAQETIIMANFLGGFLVGFVASILTRFYILVSKGIFFLAKVSSLEELLYLELGLACGVFLTAKQEKEKMF